VSGQHHDPAALLPGKNSLYPLNRRLGGRKLKLWKWWVASSSMIFIQSFMKICQPVLQVNMWEGETPTRVYPKVSGLSR
jgi:hypothetical protein